MEADRCLTLDGFFLGFAKEQLWCSGEVVALTPKAFAVLRRLVENGGQLVSKAGGNAGFKMSDSTWCWAE